MEQLISRHAVTYAIPFCVSSVTPKTDQIVLDINLGVELPDRRVAFLPKGFVTDFHSVPKWLWSLWPPYNSKTNLAAMVHDWLYIHWDQHVVNYPELDTLSYAEARHYADWVFLGLMDQFSPGTNWRNYLYYVAVRLFGHWNWTTFRTEAAQLGSRE